MKEAPCKGCKERFTACSDKCPIDLRGGYGHKAWLADYHKQEAQKRALRIQKNDDAYRDERNGFSGTKRRRK